MLCTRGCGQTATHYSTRLKQWFCFRWASKCPVIRSEISKKLKLTFSDSTKHPCYGRILSEETKTKIGRANAIANLGNKDTEETKRNKSKAARKSYAEGRRNPEDYKHKIAESNKKHWAKHLRVPWNKGTKTGQVPWNKGLRKQESSEILSREDLAYSNFRKYRNRVAVRTKKTYMQYKDEINPNNLLLGKCGIDGAHQIDHIITVREGFEQGIAIEEISAKENLQVIPWLENVQKYDGKGLRKNNKRSP